MDPTVCPGPFDVVIERRTVQLVGPEERVTARERLAARLRVPGLLVSHQHLGGWRPGEPRDHFAETWLREHGIAVVDRSEPSPIFDPPPGRIAWLLVTSG